MNNGISGLREFGNFRLDVGKRVLWHEGEPVNLALKEIQLLCVLTENGGEVVTKDELLDKVWQNSFVEESNLSRHIYVLRKTLKDLGERGDLIKTVPRRGYRFAGEVREITNSELVVEKHTSTKTMIEIRDEPLADLEPKFAVSARSLTGSRHTRRLVLSFAAIIVVFAAGIFLFLSFEKAGNGSPTREIKSIAILPVKSFSANVGDDNELRMRITDALITRLGGLDGITVRPTSAVLSYADSDYESIETGQRLKVDAVLEGRIQQEGNRLRVTLQLIRVDTGEYLWSEQFDGQADQILNLQDIITAKVSKSLVSDNREQPALAQSLTDNTEAYEAYLKGRYFWYKRDEASLRRAIDYFTQAATQDPQFSEAYTGLADTQHLLFNYNIEVTPEIIAKAKENLRRALELKPGSPDALITLGTIQMGSDWDWEKAEESLKLATANAPNSSVAHMRYGALLIRMRRFDEALTEFERAVELDPLSIVSNSNLGMAQFCRKDFAAAERQYRKTLEIDENVGSTHWLLSRNLWLAGRKGEAVEEIARGLELDRNMPLAERIREAARTSTENAIKLLLHQWRTNPLGTNPHNLAYLSTYIGDNERAVYWLEKSFEERHPWTTWISAAPEFESLVTEPRYQKLLQQMNLVY